MNYIVAVSGGVDSVVLLDMLASGSFRDDGDQLIVAHVDHGIRGEASRADMRFVRGLAAQYGLEFVHTSLELGPDASEETARSGRYEFLTRVAREYSATVVTAHHRDDMVESVAINLSRGTRWRGLAVLSREGMARPLLYFTKEHLYSYATHHRLEWVEDDTNATDKYLRNRLRRALHTMPEADKQRLVELRDEQVKLARDIDATAAEVLAGYSDNLRHVFIMVPHDTGVELMRSWIYLCTGTWVMYPAAERALVAAKVAHSGAKHRVNATINLSFTARNVVVL